jgi:hypothetical protein
MSEAELLEAISYTGSSIGIAGMSFVTVVFAYIIAAHFAGRQLTSKVAAFTSTVYSLFLTAPLIDCTLSVVKFGKLNARYVTDHPSSDLVFNIPVEVVLFVSLTPLVIGWLVSLGYMHAVVRARKGDP